MTILALVLIGLLIVLQIRGLYSVYKRRKKPQKIEAGEAEQFFKSVGYFSGCLAFLLYFVGMFVSMFAIHSKIVILLMVIYILSEFWLMCIRFKKTQDSTDWDDMENRFLEEDKSWKYIIPELIKTGFLIYVFVVLVLQL